MDDKNCLDCRHCYVDDLFFEIMCKLNHIICKDENLEIDGVCEDFECE